MVHGNAAGWPATRSSTAVPYTSSTRNLRNTSRKTFTLVSEVHRVKYKPYNEVHCVSFVIPLVCSAVFYACIRVKWCNEERQFRSCIKWHSVRYSSRNYEHCERGTMPLSVTLVYEMFSEVNYLSDDSPDVYVIFAHADRQSLWMCVHCPILTSASLSSAVCATLSVFSICSGVRKVKVLRLEPYEMSNVCSVRAQHYNNFDKMVSSLLFYLLVLLLFTKTHLCKYNTRSWLLLVVILLQLLFYILWLCCYLYNIYYFLSMACNSK